MTKPHVLIAGASIAGPALAYWLDRYGWSTTVVERAPRLRTGGQNIDVRGAGREVVRRMGLEDAVRGANTGELGTRFLGPDGTVVAEFPAGTGDSDGPTAELEILRGDLARLLVERTDRDASGGGSEEPRGRTEYVWGDRVTALAQDDTGVTVSFDVGPERRFDLVVAADGIGSRTRGLVFGDEVVLRDLGMETSWLTIPRIDSDQDWWRWFNAPGGRTVTLRPDPVGTIRATLSRITKRRAAVPASETTSDDRSIGDHVRELRSRFGDVGWAAPRVLAALDDAEDLYFQQIAQVRAPRWSAGRVALVGDAAGCPSPISGMGTSVALVGAYVLAGELAAHVDHRDAFAGYERIARPYVEQAQQLPPGTPRLANPQTRAGIRAFGLGLRLAASPPARKLGSFVFTPRAEKMELPEYGHLEASARA